MCSRGRTCRLRSCRAWCKDCSQPRENACLPCCRGSAPPGIAEQGAEVWRGDKLPSERGFVALGVPTIPNSSPHRLRSGCAMRSRTCDGDGQQSSASSLSPNRRLYMSTVVPNKPAADIDIADPRVELRNASAIWRTVSDPSCSGRCCKTSAGIALFCSGGHFSGSARAWRVASFRGANAAAVSTCRARDALNRMPWLRGPPGCICPWNAWAPADGAPGGLVHGIAAFPQTCTNPAGE